MSRYAVTRSIATAFMAIAATLLIVLVAAVPIAGVSPMTAAFAGLVVVGAGMLLRERVLVRVER